MNYVSNDNATALMTAIAGEIVEVQDMVATSFSTSQAYQVGDVVKYEDKLYRFKASHSAGAWNASDVDEVNVVELIDDVEVSALTTAEVNALIALL